MANVEGNRGGGIRGRTRSGDHVVQEFVPSAAWTEDSDCHYLLVDLPDFRKEEVKLQVDKSGQITVSGERLVNNNKYIYFDKAFKAPENSDIDKITGKFADEILYVTLPKKPQIQKKEPNEIIDQKDEGIAKDGIPKEKEEPSSDQDHDHEVRSRESNDQEQTKGKKEDSKKGSCVDGFHKEIIEKWGRECSILEKVTNMLLKNKEILVTAALAFSLGVLVSRKFESSHQQD